MQGPKVYLRHFLFIKMLTWMLTWYFFYIILFVISSSNMPPMHSVCHFRFFCYWVDRMDHFKNNFKKSRTDLRAKSVQGLNREMTQNVGTKSAFTPRKNIYVGNNFFPLIIPKGKLYVEINFLTLAFQVTPPSPPKKK